MSEEERKEKQELETSKLPHASKEEDVVNTQKIVNRTGLLTVKNILYTVFFLLLFGIIVSAIIKKLNRQQIITQFRCMRNVGEIQKAMIIYAGDFDNRYPPKDKWCDLLIDHARVSKEDFICPGSKAKTGQSSYAINENAITLEPPIMRGIQEPNAPPDIVLLFESEPGWNQYGGPELLTFKNHKGEGCYIVFTDGHMEFIGSKEANNLKWKPDVAQKE